MYNEERKELMDEGYTEALDACKLMVENKLNGLLEKCRTPETDRKYSLFQAQIEMVDVFNSIKKEMDEL